MTDNQNSTIRIFAALKVSQTLSNQVAALPRKGLDAVWTHPEDLHITLRFLGDVSREVTEDAKNTLESVRRPAFHVEVGGFGTFKQHGQSVLWAKVQSTRKLEVLTAEVNNALLRLGFEMPLRPFVPHVTLARIKNENVLNSYMQTHERSIKTSWKVNYFSLLCSGSPNSNGVRYTELAKYDLH